MFCRRRTTTTTTISKHRCCCGSIVTTTCTNIMTTTTTTSRRTTSRTAHTHTDTHTPSVGHTAQMWHVVQWMLASKYPLEEHYWIWQKHIWYQVGILLPIRSIFLGTTDFVAALSVENHAREEGDVEVGQGGMEAAGEPPAKRHQDVPCVLHLAREGVPAVHQQVAPGGADERDGLLQHAPRHLRKRIAHHPDLHVRLLRVGRVEHVVTHE
mmetsp:Transcript_30484/g.51494  ORF Transcript_30484/g.51494 Transcript_30484/m.51494 type:complete len:211 (-) Transcript_30484:1099-1731(-)